jgi:murein L,D-transpeptidase YafK
MKLNSYSFFVVVLFGVFFFYRDMVASESQTVEASEPLQLFFYSTDSPANFVVVEKKHQRLKLFEQKDNLKMVKEFTCATGENPGTKKTSGDARTPEGIYHITEIYEDKRITVFGSRAFHLDYPNVFDAHAGHNGDGIFIHGTNKKLIPNSTNGCITLNNSDLNELAPYLAVNAMPIIVLDSESELILGDNPPLEKNSILFNDALDKLSLNSEKIPLENIKTLSYLKQGPQAIISITYSVFDDKLTQYNERKRAYLTHSPTGNWRTLYSVQYQDTIPKILALRLTKNQRTEKANDLVVATANSSQIRNITLTKPSIPTARTNNPVVRNDDPEAKTSRPANIKPLGFDKGEELLAFIEKWRIAWVTKDIETYINCYSPSFKSGNLNRQEWRAKKGNLNTKYKYITVSLRDIVIEWTSTGANVTFQQTYKSDQLQTSGTKTLHLVNRKNRWMIENELM